MEEMKEDSTRGIEARYAINVTPSSLSLTFIMSIHRLIIQGLVLGIDRVYLFQPRLTLGSPVHQKPDTVTSMAVAASSNFSLALYLDHLQTHIDKNICYSYRISRRLTSE